MGRKRVDPEERKEFVGIRLPAWLISKIKKEGTLQNIIEKNLKEKYKRE